MHDLLTPEAERELATAAHAGDKAARDQLILHNLRLVGSIARRYAGRGTDHDDLVQYGTLGLMRAVDKFDPSQGRFTTYATWWIKQAIQRGIWNERFVRVPAYLYADPSDLAKAAETNRKAAQRLDLMKHADATLNVVRFRNDPDYDRWSAIPDDADGPDAAAERADEQARADAILATMSPKQRAVVRAYHGFDADPQTFHQIARTHGCSHQRIQYHHQTAIRQARRRLGVA